MASEFSTVKRQRMDRSPLLGAAGMIGMIIRIVPAKGEFHLGIFFEEADHRASVVEKRVDARCIEMIAGFVLDICSRLLDGVVDAGARGQWIARHPQPSAGPRRGSAKHAFLLDDK